MVVRVQPSLARKLPGDSSVKRSKRRVNYGDAAGDLAGGKKLVAKVHFIALVPNCGAPGSPIFRMAEEDFAYDKDERPMYKRALAKQLAAAARVVAISRTSSWHGPGRSSRQLPSRL